MPHLLHSNLTTITSFNTKSSRTFSSIKKTTLCKLTKKKKKTLHLNTTQKRICNYNVKPVEISSVFGIKRHGSQFYFHIGHVSVCVSSWSAPLAFTVWSRSGSLLLSLLMLRPRLLLRVVSLKRPAVWFKHKQQMTWIVCYGHSVVNGKRQVYSNWETSKNKSNNKSKQSSNSRDSLHISPLITLTLKCSLQRWLTGH